MFKKYIIIISLVLLVLASGIFIVVLSKKVVEKSYESQVKNSDYVPECTDEMIAKGLQCAMTNDRLTDNNKEKNNEEIDTDFRSDLDRAVRDYLELGSNINDQVSQNIAVLSTAPRVLGISNTDANGLSRGERISRGVGTFWEIGRSKHISEAKRINIEDLQYIADARQGANFALVEMGGLARRIPSSRKLETDFANWLIQYYRGLDKFLYQLKLYKQFNGDQLRLATTGRLVQSGENLMDYYRQSFGMNEQTQLQYLINTRDQVKKVYDDAGSALEEVAVNMGSSTIPHDFVDPDLLAELVSLRVEMFGGAAVYDKHYADNYFTKKGEDSGENEGEKALEQALRAKDEIDQVLLRIKVSSNLSNIFNRVAQVDKKIKDALPQVKKAYNFNVKSNQPYLRDLMEQYVRDESKMLKEVEEYNQTLDQELAGAKLGMSSFDLKRSVGRIKVSMITNSECNRNAIFNLKSPSGNLISEDHLFLYDNIIFGSTHNSQFFVIDNPKTGRWEESVKLPGECDEFHFKPLILEVIPVDSEVDGLQ